MTLNRRFILTSNGLRQLAFGCIEKPLPADKENERRSDYLDQG